MQALPQKSRLRTICVENDRQFEATERFIPKPRDSDCESNQLLRGKLFLVGASMTSLVPG